jgi:5,6,7,8-tetrahydromethanopterin hydro-lyase
MFGPAQRRIAMAIADCVESGAIPAAEAEDLFVCEGVFIHWLAEHDDKIQKYNYAATKEALERAVRNSPSIEKVLEKKGTAVHPFAANSE